MPGQHGLQEGVLEAADRKADALALEVGDAADRAVVQHQQGVEGRCDQRSHPRQRQPLGGLDMKLGLVGDGQVRLAGGHQLGRVVGVGRLDHLDLEAGLGEEALLLGHHQGRVVGVEEPVEQQGELFGLGRAWRKQRRKAQGQEPEDGAGQARARTGNR